MLKKFQCPKCGHVQEALASSIGHRCPMNKNRWTNYEEKKTNNG